jgi:hypothetical protein
MKTHHQIPKNREIPALEEIRNTLNSTVILPVEIENPVLQEFLARLRKNHANGEAHLFCFEFGPSEVYDFYTGRNRWSFDAHIDLLLEHPTILPQLAGIRVTAPVNSGLGSENSFLLDGHFAALLYSGGAYTHPQGDGREEKEFAINVCKEMFGLRYGEVSVDKSGMAWTPWFYNIAWDMTIVVFDKRLRCMWLFAITDTD